MIKPQELRLGNYVNVPNQNQCPFRIDAIEFLSETYGKFAMGKDKKQHPLTWYLEDITPIPLTEEWLLKFGFEDTGVVLFRETGNLGSIDWDGMSFYVNMILHENLKFVHQLQNLFYSLSGEELTIKEIP